MKCSKRCRRKSRCYMPLYCVGTWNMGQSSKPFIVRPTIRRQRCSRGLWMWTRAKFCLLRCSNCWEKAVNGNSLRRWSAKRAWSTQRMRRWWTEHWEARASVIWRSSGKLMSWKAASHVSQSIGRSISIAATSS